MRRKFSAVIFVALLALVGLSGVANTAFAAPYPPEAVVSVGINGGDTVVGGDGSPAVDANGNVIIDGIARDANGNPIVDANGNFVISGTFTFSGQGFDPGELIVFSISGPSGLRGSSALSKLVPAAPGSVNADANGNFSTSVTVNEAGTFTITATGQTSGTSASLTFTVSGSSATGGGTDSGIGTGAGAGAGQGAGAGGNDGSGGLAYTGAGSIGGTGLAYTGASVAGPLAIGFVALFAGLALLFFGTRGVRRRRNSQAAV